MSTRVLVCDDESLITRAISMKLRKGGFEVETAANGRIAWEAVQRETPAMIITDYQMPEMNGLELCRLVRMNAESADVPIVLLTAKGFELDEEELRQQFGISQIAIKPFSPREILAIVQSTLADIVEV